MPDFYTKYVDSVTSCMEEAGWKYEIKYRDEQIYGKGAVVDQSPEPTAPSTRRRTRSRIWVSTGKERLTPRRPRRPTRHTADGGRPAGYRRPVPTRMCSPSAPAHGIGAVAHARPGPVPPRRRRAPHRAAGRGASAPTGPARPSAGRTARSGCRGRAPPASRPAGPGRSAARPRSGRVLGERQREPLQLLDQLGGEPLLELLDRAGWISLQPDPARLVQGSRADLLQQLLDHAADPHDLGRLLDHAPSPGSRASTSSPPGAAAERHAVRAHDQDLRVLRRPFVPRHLHAAIVSHRRLPGVVPPTVPPHPSRPPSATEPTRSTGRPGQRPRRQPQTEEAQAEPDRHQPRAERQHLGARPCGRPDGGRALVPRLLDVDGRGAEGRSPPSGPGRGGSARPGCPASLSRARCRRARRTPTGAAGAAWRRRG